MIDADGWLQGALQIPSAHHDRRPTDEVSLLVVHAISLPPRQHGGPHITALFTGAIDPARHAYFAGIAELRVSAHVLIRRDGGLVQYVPFSRRAWHAGVSSWRGRERCNDFSIGVELEGSDHVPFEAGQYRSLARLVATLLDHYPIADVVGHQDIAPGRKTDPGPFFDWMRLASDLAGRGKRGREIGLGGGKTLA